MISIKKTRARLAVLSVMLLGCERPVDGEAVDQRSDALTTADVRGFEASGQWTIIQGQAQSLSLTDLRTKGVKALAVGNPSGYTRLESAPLSSTDPELAEIERGVSIAVDLMVPAEQANPYWSGAVQMYVSCPSRNTYNAYLGQVELTGMRTGVYGTLRFKVPDYAADALKGATYSDLTFGIVLNVPTGSPGVYRLDNLRVKGKLPPPPTNESEIQAGESILLEPWKSYAPAETHIAEQSFAQGVIQIPRSFHVVKGRTGSGSATFEFKLGAAQPASCNYTADPATRQDYVLASCQGGALAGDLVPADFVRLTVVNGDPAQGKTKIKAQIALNPIEDDLLAGLPPIPTFFGSTAAEVQATLNGFFQEQLNWQVSDSVLVSLPTPAIAPHDSIIRNGETLPPARPPEDNDPPFGISGRLTGNDLADAGWHVSGALAAPVTAQGARTTQFDLDIGADAYLLGSVRTVVGLSGFVETVTPPPGGGSATLSADFCYEYFGSQLSCAGPFNAQTGLNHEIPGVDERISLPVILYPPFIVTAGLDLVIDATLEGSFSPSGFDIELAPHVRLDADLRGEINAAGFAGGGLFVTANIVDLSVPITAAVSATLNLTPGSCKVQVAEELSAQAVVSSGSGAIGYYLFAGLCCGCTIEVCWRDEGNIWSWPAYPVTTLDILPASPLFVGDLPLDTALCPPLDDAPGNVLYPLNQQTFKQGDRSFMAAGFTIFVPDDSTSTGFAVVQLDNQIWTSNCPSDVVSGNTIQYGTCDTRTLTVVATSSSNPGVGSGTDSVVVKVTANDPAVAPAPQILSPAPGLNLVCTTDAAGTASDPNGQSVTLEWYAAEYGEFPGMSVGSGTSLSPLTVDGVRDLIRLVATDPDGNQGTAEIPAHFACLN